MKPPIVGWIEEELWRKIHASVPIVCVDIAVVWRKYVLLLKRSVEPEAGKWWFPGSRLYRNEAPEAAAHRIAWMEAGLLSSPLTFLVWESAFYAGNPWGEGGGAHTLNLIYRMDYFPPGEVLDFPKITRDENHSAHTWWDGEPGSLSGIGESPLKFGRMALGLQPMANVQDEIEKTVMRSAGGD